MRIKKKVQIMRMVKEDDLGANFFNNVKKNLLQTSLLI